MVKTKKQTILILSAVLILLIALGVSAVFAQVEDQSAGKTTSQSALQDDGQTQDEPEDDGSTDADSDADSDADCLPGMGSGKYGDFGGRGGMHGHGFGFPSEGLMPMSDVVAESLGVTEEQLQEAHTQVMEALLAENDGDPRGFHGFADSDEFNTLLAEKLSEISGKEISVADIEAAHEAAREALLEQMPEGFGLTEEQLALMEARQALKDAIDRDAILMEAAKSLGLDETAIQDALAERHGLLTLLEDVGISIADFMAAQQEAYANAVQNAVPEFLTQEQADLLLENGAGSLGFDGMPGGFHAPGGFGGHHGRGGFGGFERFAPSGDAATTDGTSL